MATDALLSGKFYQRFRQNRLALVSTILFAALTLVAAFANVVANDRPILMGLGGKVYAPAFVDYVPSDFVVSVEAGGNAEAGGELSGFVVDYLALAPEIERAGWAVWPPIVQRPFEPNLNFDELPAPPGSSSVVGQTETFPGRKVDHVIGTDTAGRDLLTRLIYGCRTSLLMAIATTMIAMILGVALGSLMGYAGGVFDLIMGRFLETLGYFPVIFMIIILVAFLETPGLGAIIAIFALLGISPFAFYMRGQVLSARKEVYVEAARALGQSSFKIMFKHILPNAFGPIMVLIPFAITSDISFLATIDFLGFGVQPPTASLGSIMRSGFDSIEQRGWLVLYSSVVLVAILLLVNFIGDGVRDGFDPHATISKQEFRRWIKSLRAGGRAPVVVDLR
jgi:microcin C transport system permease protein